MTGRSTPPLSGDASSRRGRRRTLDDGRLAAVAALVPPGARVADVGSGHGLLARQLLLDGRASHCIATERTARRATLVRIVPAGHPLAHAAEVRSGDGLAPLRPADRLDVLVLAGMGARTIARILADPRLAELRIPRVVLQPQTEPAGLRGFLRAHDFGVVDERIAEDRGRRYVALAAEPGAASPSVEGFSEAELDEVGPALLARRDPLLRPWWEARLERLEGVLRASDGAGTGGRRAAEQARFARRVLAALAPEPGRRA